MKEQYSFPLLRDHHTHPSFYSMLSDCINISNTQNKEDLYKTLKTLPEDRISVILGWNSSFYKFDLEDEKSFPPVIISDLSLHGVFVSEKAKGLIPDNFKLIIENYKDSEWCEKNLSQIMSFLTGFYEIDINKLDRYFNSLLKIGVYYVEDMLVTDENFIKIVENSKYRDRTSFWADLKFFELFSKKTREKIKGIKVFTDGALGANTAAVRSGYLDGAEGGLLYSDKSLYDQLLKVQKTGKSVSVHAIGDITLKQLIGIVEKLNMNDIKFPQFRVEHCQFIDMDTAIKAKKAGLILSMQPNFSFETIAYLDRLPEEYLKGNNPFRMLIDKVGFEPGKDLIFGSDGMPHGVYTALKAAFFPPLENQKLNLAEFVAGYCMETEETGKIEFTIDYDMKDIVDIKVIANT